MSPNTDIQQPSILNAESIESLDTLAFQIFRIHHLIQENSEWLFNDLGVTHSRARIIIGLSKQNKPTSISELARSIGLTRQAVQRLANQMIEEDILCIDQDSQSNKSKLLQLTDVGLTLYAEIRRRRNLLIEHALDEKSLAKLISAHDSLHILEDTLKNLRDESVREELNPRFNRQK